MGVQLSSKYQYSRTKRCELPEFCYLRCKLFANAAIKNGLKAPVIACHSIDVCRNPGFILDQPPIYCKTSIDDVLKKNALGTTIAFTKRMNDVQIAVGFGNFYYEI